MRPATRSQAISGPLTQVVRPLMVWHADPPRPAQTTLPSTERQASAPAWDGAAAAMPAMPASAASGRYRATLDISVLPGDARGGRRSLSAAAGRRCEPRHSADARAGARAPGRLRLGCGAVRRRPVAVHLELGCGALARELVLVDRDDGLAVGAPDRA